MKKQLQRAFCWVNYTKSDDCTMETIPNCTNFHDEKGEIDTEKWLQRWFWYGILKQNKRENAMYLHISTLVLPNTIRTL